jgi:hypothetical protein
MIEPNPALETADAETLSEGTPLRHILRNYARGWGEIKRMTKHLPGVWWFSCEDKESGGESDGFLVCERDFELKGLPNYQDYRIGQLSTGEGVYAFPQGRSHGGRKYDDMDHFLLQWFCPTLAQEVYQRGYLHAGTSLEELYPDLGKYLWFLDKVVQTRYTEVFEGFEEEVGRSLGEGEFNWIQMHLPGVWAFEWGKKQGGESIVGVLVWEKLAPELKGDDLQTHRVGQVEGSDLLVFLDLTAAQICIPGLLESVFHQGFQLSGGQTGEKELRKYRRGLMRKDLVEDLIQQVV